VAYPKIDAEPYERGDGIVFDKIQLVTVLHCRYYNILKFLFGYFAADDLQFLKLLLLATDVFFF
jgi:hypothetical protein